MRICCVCLLFVLTALVAPTYGQAGQAEQTVKTSAPSDARFELVQSTLAAKFTVKLDKQTGTVYQLVSTKEGDDAWQKMKRDEHSVDLYHPPGKVNYQIFTSGLALKHTFLINVNTGATWLLVHDSKTEEDSWQAMPTF